MTRVGSKRTVTVLAQDLQPLALAAGDKVRYPALETLLSRGHHFRMESKSPDHFRFQLFGIKPEGELPIASLTRAADREEKPGQQHYWLRLDPVTLWADMARVVMTSYGFADLNEFERDEIENVVRSVLREEGIVLQSGHLERWCIALGESPEFDFTPLDEAVGMDMAEALPEQPESIHWQRIMNEIQVALHASAVNVRRRQQGKQAINSVWFWGGGFIPNPANHKVFDTVYADNPVTRGLAIISDCRLRNQTSAEKVRFGPDEQSILVDWTVGTRDPMKELDHLERFVDHLLDEVRSGSTELVFYCGKNEGWRYRRSSGRKFWCYRRPLGKICVTSLPA